MFSTQAIVAQQGFVSGVVRGIDHQLLQFVNIAVKGTTAGVTTGKDGRFELSVPANKDVVILFSYIGYEKDSLTVRLKENERRIVDHALLPNSTQLESIEVKD